MLKTISRRFSEFLVHNPAAADKAQRVDHFRTTLNARDAWLSLQMKKVINYRRHKHLVLYTHATRVEFQELWNKAGGEQGAGIGEKNRFATDQIRLRLHCYGVSPTTTPCVSGRAIGTGISGAKAFLVTLLSYFKREKNNTPKLTLPLIGAHRKARNNLDVAAVNVDIVFAAEITKMTETFMASHVEGVFVAYKFKQPAHVNVGVTKAKKRPRKKKTKNAASRGTKRKQPTTPDPEEVVHEDYEPSTPDPSDLEEFTIDKIISGPRKDDGCYLVSWVGFDSSHNLWQEADSLHPELVADFKSQGPELPEEGEMWEREGTVYQLFRIFETVNVEGQNSLACAYFEVERARADGLDLEFFERLSPEMERSNFLAADLDYLEVSFHGEVMQWIQDSDLPLPSAPAGYQVACITRPITVPHYPPPSPAANQPLLPHLPKCPLPSRR